MLGWAGEEPHHLITNLTLECAGGSGRTGTVINGRTYHVPAHVGGLPSKTVVTTNRALFYLVLQRSVTTLRIRFQAESCRNKLGMPRSW